MVSCDPEDRETYFRSHPSLIIEVRSPSIERLNRYEKFLFYQCLDSLQEYLIISQDYRQVQVFRRASQWGSKIFTEGELWLRSVDLAVTLDQVYRRIDI